ncbi:amidase signature domain containing protein [Babesia gibsoni]|uniref:Amidase signature domain containing protein n=1 Tax=Babesia gibsoni TaxID=33632 RepID=A0AAD8USX1_BABGI|nr:amidase signature domain containing protein [Babesia gibsoni]
MDIVAGFHYLLAILIQNVAFTSAFSYGLHGGRRQLGWICGTKCLSHLQNVQYGLTEKDKIYHNGGRFRSHERYGQPDSASVVSENDKESINCFLEEQERRKNMQKTDHGDCLASAYLQKRLQNIVNGIDNSQIIDCFGLNRYKSFTYFLDDKELVEQVVAVMRQYRKNLSPLLLFGEPIAIKDNISVKGIPFSNGSQLFDGYRSTYDAHVVQQLRDQGAIIIGKTIMNEFGVGSETVGALNPFGSQYMIGGSSGGAASAVSGNIVKMALGTDTGGSIRLPAALCGCVGYRPSYGLLSRYGISELAAKLDVVATCTNNVLDSIRLVYSMMKPCYKDYTSLENTESVSKGMLSLMSPDSIDSSGAGKGHEMESVNCGQSRLDGIKIASLDPAYLLSNEMIDTVVADHIKEVEATFRTLGAEVITVKPPDLHEMSKKYHIYVASQMAANLQRFADRQYHQSSNHLTVEEMMQKMEATTVQRLKMGIDILRKGHDTEKVLESARDNITSWLSRNGIFTDIPLLITPVSAGVAPEKSGDLAISDTIKDDTFNTLAPIIGACSIALPSLATYNALPCSFQLTAAQFNDVEMLRVAMIYESHIAKNETGGDSEDMKYVG